MAIGVKPMAYTIAAFGVQSFIYGIVAENRKPTYGTRQVSTQGDRIICKNSSDPSVVLGFLSIASLAISVLVGYLSVFYPYSGKSVPRHVFFRCKTFVVFFLITLALSMLAAVILCWMTISELVHLTNNVHRDMNTSCPTAKSGLFGGAAFLALSASLFWLISLMLAYDVRTYHFEEQEDTKAQALKTDYDHEESKQQSEV
ncbi:hypothetical protein CCACVL1_11464 [Corchorus capsularis]|uniref:Uncharacterized protein n=1 Tax=Corchorus capsularis TaxID=210143 RepID=A0A1R3IKZ5_COCAP|nr:hypothetical protein CCACVL1_11464 [Corchorus capsularis]